MSISIFNWTIYPRCKSMLHSIWRYFG